MFGSLLNMLDKRSIGDVAQALGQPEQSVSRCMETSIATLLGGLASKAEDTGALRRILDMVSGTTGPVSWSSVASSVTDPGSSLMAAGKRILPAIFGTGEKDVTAAIGKDSGLPSGAITTLLSMAAPVVIGYLGKLVRDGGLTMSGLAGLLQKESATIRNALPAGLSSIFWPAAATTAAQTASPVIAQEVHRERSFNGLPILALCGLGLGLAWFLSQARRPVVPSVVGTANRVVEPLPAAPKPVCALPANVTLPQGGAESRIYAFIVNPESRVGANTWFGFDQINFDSGSAKLRSGSQGQLDNVAAILNSCPSVHVNIAGFTDNVGSPDANLRLSQNRAKTVVAQLERRGVPSDRLSMEGHGENDPVADNSTADGRAQNRRTAMQVTQK
jgi:outer membrane protein OmpA-like peptidoglycan-associated protein